MPTEYQNLQTKTCSLRLRAFTSGLTPGVLSPISDRALKTDWGLGEHHVSTEEGRIEKSFGIAVRASLLLIRACHQAIRPGTSWSIAQLQHAFRLRLITNQVEHNVKTRLTQARNVA
jgi:hypothetical protein